MKKACILVTLLFACASAHWINTSELLNQGKRPEPGSDYVHFIANEEMVFKLDHQTTTKWKIRPDQPPCTLSISSGTSVIKSCVVEKGSLSFKQILEPGVYKVKVSGNARIEFLKWRVHKMKAMIPMGGGVPAFIVIHNKKVSYFRAAPDTVPVLKIKGPTKVFIYVRVDVPDLETMQTLDVAVTDKVDGKEISHKTASKHKSKKALYMDNKTVFPGKALIITFDVPNGNHEYAVTMKGPHGAVKFYAENQSQTGSQNHQRVLRW
jgi:hypothetical protein